MGNGGDINKSLKRLCRKHGWCYGVFWRSHPHNPMNLTMEDAYYEEEEEEEEEDAYTESVVGSMLMQVHHLGQGMIGGVAVDGNHRWLFADAISWDISEFGLQFASGIKTIALIPVGLCGVVQLASIQQIAETREMVDQVSKCFQETLDVVSGGNDSSSFISDAADQYEPFSSMTPSQKKFFQDVSTSWVNTVEDVGNSLMFGSMDVQLLPYGENLKHGNDNYELLIQPGLTSLVESTLNLFEEQFEVADFPPSSFDTFQINDLTQWLADSSELCITSLDTMSFDESPHTIEVDGVSLVPSRYDRVSSIQVEEQVCSFKNCFSNASNSCEKVETFAVNANDDELLVEFGVENVVGSLGQAYVISERMSDTVAAPRKGLFSELGLEHILKDEWPANSISSSKSYNDEWPPSKRRKAESYETISNHAQHTCFLWGPELIRGQFHEFTSLKECMPKVQSGMCVEKSYDMDAKSCITVGNSQSRKLNEPTKPMKKRAKPGESKKPRPKDRQQITERINELRNLIPNASKLSIDALLSRTIKHMNYLQNLSKHGNKIKQVHEPKLIGQGNELVPKSSSGGATWAFEVGGSNVVCPIVVEDLGHPGQMLIEMLCKERDYFMEMANIVRSFGLTILKGVMEEQSDKIWAQFIVEAKKQVERVQVFMSLMQIFHGPTSNEIKDPEQNSSNVSELWGNYQHHVVPIV